MGGMDAIIAEFLAESVENLDRLDQDLVVLERNPDDREVFSRIFRTIHTIKGTCGFLAFQKLESVSHAGESLLSRLRDGSLALTPEITTELLAMIDAVRTILAAIDRDGNEGDADYAALIGRLQRLESGAEPPDAAAAPRRQPAGPKSAAATHAAARNTRTAPQGGRVRAKRTGTPSADCAPAPKAEPAEATEPAESLELASGPAAAETTIRVDVRILDHLMNLVGELVLGRNQLMQNLTGSTDSHLVATAQRLDAVTSELQEAVMRTRMQPISTIWQKLPRFVRDLTLKFGKEVTVELVGEETELDKSVIEAIKGSLLHLVRNAVDHGIETPSEREAAGKPRAGTLRLTAHHEGGNVVIEVSDDGAGLDHERILGKALAAGLVNEEQAAELGPQQVEALVFAPGFSTAAEVTNISGRGVGLDVVRANVESLGGVIELRSEPGLSTTFRIKIPLTLAIVSVLLVEARDHRIAIPQADVVEIVRLQGGPSELGIESLNGVPVYRLRGRLLPLVFLDRELGLAGGEPGSGTSIVVLHGDEHRFGLVVDGVRDSQEIVVKPLGHLLAGVPFVGATILGDGRIALILDVMRLGLAAGAVAEERQHTIASLVSSAVRERRERARLIFLQGRNDERLAVDFDAVTRLEHIPRAAVEKVAGRQVVQYGDRIMELIDIQNTLPERRVARRDLAPEGADEMVSVVVCTLDGRLVGLVAHRILDIVEESLRARRAGSREGVRACAVIQERITEILDLEKLVRLADPEFFERESGEPA